MVTDTLMKPLVNAVIDGMKNRFSLIFGDEQYHVASMLIPKLKLNYLPEGERQMQKIALVRAVHALDRHTTTATAADPASQPVSDQNDDDYLFSFVKQNPRSVSTTGDISIDEEIDNYFKNTETATSSLLNFPHLLQAFLKYNAALPSGAAVERLFSCAGQILVPRRCKVSDDMFDKLVFL